MDPLVACPIMCAGGTVFEPIVDYVSPGKIVGIGALGGLGTLALKLCKLYGAKVVVFSSSAHKEQPALKAGADVFVCTGDAERMAAAPKCDVFLETAPVNRPVAPLMDLLKFDGVYVRMGIPPAGDQSFTWEWIPMIFTAKKIVGSIVTGSARMGKLLTLASDHLDFIQDVGDLQAEYVPFDQVNEAMAKLSAQKNSGFRMVLKW